jgi:phosphoenolpyruvate carboxykinase (GTP)
MSTPLEKWVEEQAQLTKPDRIHWCDGSEKEARELIEIGRTKEKINGNPVFAALNQDAWPNAYLHRSHPTDVARTEHLTYVCHPDKKTAGPNNNWMEPAEAKRLMRGLSDGCMRGRTMYVLPYMMGHPDSPYAKACVQLTDVSYVAVSMRIMTRMGKAALERIGASDHFVRGLHSVGDFDPDKRFIMHFPDEEFVWSIGSGYGGNALLGKKCFSLRIASWQGYKEGWLAEHMVIMGIEDPDGNVTYVAAALPSACGKTNLAMMRSALPGYRIWTIGDDIAWMNIGPDGRLWAINPEAGFFGVAPGTSEKTNGNMLKTLKNKRFFPTLFTNTAVDADTKEPWWEGLSKPAPAVLIDWQGKPWNPSEGKPAAHPNARFTASIYNCDALSPEYDNPSGVPISAIIFGGRRSHLVPLVTESFDWQHGVFLGARMGSETTAAAAQQVGVVRRDPMAMLPFCGYNMGEYFRHWLNMGKKLSRPPKIFAVNWFRTDAAGRFLWPGFGDNIRVLKWILERVGGQAGADSTPIGLVPGKEEFDLNGLDVNPQDMDELLSVRMEAWQQELADTQAFLEKFDTLPQELWDEYNKLERYVEQ